MLWFTYIFSAFIGHLKARDRQKSTLVTPTSVTNVYASEDGEERKTITLLLPMFIGPSTASDINRMLYTNGNIIYYN